MNNTKLFAIALIATLGTFAHATNSTDICYPKSSNICTSGSGTGNKSLCDLYGVSNCERKGNQELRDIRTPQAPVCGIKTTCEPKKDECKTVNLCLPKCDDGSKGRHDDNHCEPVPEPASMTALLAGLLPFVRRVINRG